MSQLQAGDVVYLDYGEVPRTVHARLVLSEVDRNSHEFTILTPDYDLYTEQLHQSNGDLVGYYESGPGGALPVGVPPRAVYSFAPMSAQQLARYMTDGRTEAAAERARRGLGPVAVPAAPLGAAPPPAAQIWVLASALEGHKVGETVQPPVGFPSLGSCGLMYLNDPQGVAHVVMIKQLSVDELAGFCDTQIASFRGAEAVEGNDRVVADNIRTMSVKYLANGDRMRNFRESIGEMVQVDMEDFPFEPRTTLEYLQAVQSVAESSYSHHLAWVQQSKVPEGSRAIYEDETLSQILDTAISYDALNVSNLASFELLVRRKQLIADAHSYNASAPSYDGASYYLGNKFKPGGAIVVPSLTEHVSKKLQADSAIWKERRKLEEAKGKKGGRQPAPKATPKGGQGAGQASQ